MSAPKGLNGFNEGHPITMTYNGSLAGQPLNLRKMRQVPTLHCMTLLIKLVVTLGHKVAMWISNTLRLRITDEPLTSSLMYQITKRNRGQQGTRVAQFCRGV